MLPPERSMPASNGSCPAAMTSGAQLTIGLPVYNGERFLEETLESIRAQTYADFQVLISDNCSTDRTQEICSEFAQSDPRVVYERQNRNVGAVANYNHVARSAGTRYFKWAAADDVLLPTFLDQCMSVLENQPQFISCCSKVTRIDENSRVLGPEVDMVRRSSARISTRFGDAITRQHTCFSIFGVYRTSVLMQTDLLDAHVGADRTLLAQLALFGPTYEVDEHLLLRRFHPESFSSGKKLSVEQKTEWWADAGTGSRRGRNHTMQTQIEAYCALVLNAPIDQRTKRACLRKVNLSYRASVIRRAIARRSTWPIKRRVRRVLRLDIEF